LDDLDGVDNMPGAGTLDAIAAGAAKDEVSAPVEGPLVVWFCTLVT